jgi:hypothetical protein
MSPLWEMYKEGIDMKALSGHTINQFENELI